MAKQPATDDHVFFGGDDRLEGILEWPGVGGLVQPGASEAGTAAGGVVIAHPHPLYGGTMAQPVVYRIAQACREHGLATLRFNFRGVGESRGTYSGTEEFRDVDAAAAYLRERLTGSTGRAEPGTPGGLGRSDQGAPVALAGYSFGSVMAAMAAAGKEGAAALALVAFVVGWEDMPPDALEKLVGFRGPVLAVCGDQDELAPPREVERTLSGLGLDFSLSVVRGADHFFENSRREVGERVAVFLEEAFARR
ncbi:MAG: alpha/beta family hydrolase [bacterium]